jgi:hypothetical protein
MATIRLPKQSYQRIGFVALMAIFSLWITGQAVGQVAASAYHDTVLPEVATEVVAASREQLPEPVATTSPVESAVSGTEEDHGWFIADETSRWSDQELVVVEQIMEHTWRALDEVGLDGQTLLDGYRFRRAAAEFVPGRERLLAIVDHKTMEITLADGAFERLHGFYIYHELGHAVDFQLERLPSQAYHRIAGQAAEEVAETNDTWSTTTGFWLRYHGRDDREEATADAFAWWVMSQAGQPKPFFPGTPVTTDYDQVSRTIEEAVREAAATDAQPA